ncbi:Arrestin domain-containing protein 3 [Habropoda laboriosa]|uniref:Arrestin domain-containing protein 3 n=2 Tax=Habropoda laboriosa TaxID=597456 RepID=A0A0L7RE34_9HYME|nr:Arrestin domain-containing protein 3 [Habropoda laboriosa]
MPSLTTFRIDFDRPGATYTTGDTVTGKIVLDILREKKVRGLTLNAKGEARVHWSESESRSNTSQSRRTTEHTTYRNSEEYFQFKYNIVGTNKPNVQEQIPVGFHMYPFTFQLPNNIPSSFEHSFGRVRYTVKAVIDRPWKFNHECKAAFTVVSPLDLNENREKCIGVEDEATHKFCCFCLFFCINQGSVNLRVNVPSSGYVSGQSIISTVDYLNSSHTVSVTAITTKLERSVKFYASLPSKKVKFAESEIKSTKSSSLQASRGQVSSDILVPPTPPSNLQYCSIIDLDYKLSVYVHVSGLHCKIKKSYPLLIGTVPLYCQPSAPYLDETDLARMITGKEAASTRIPMPMPNAPYPVDGPPHDQAASSSFVPLNQPGISSTSYDIPPPSYEECVLAAATIRDHDESNYVFGANDRFAPKYPVFNYPPRSDMKR